MNKLNSILALCLLAVLILPITAQNRYEFRQKKCKLAYNYNRKDGLITCVSAGMYYTTYWPHPQAWTNRQLPSAGSIVVISFFKDTQVEFGREFWWKVYF